VLGKKYMNYGKIRVAGSIGFVCMSLILHFFGKTAMVQPRSLIIWIVSPALLFALSLMCNPQLFKKKLITQNLFEEKPKVNLKTMFKDIPNAFWLGMIIIFLYFLGTVPNSKFLPLYVTDYLQKDGVPLLFAISALAEIPLMFYSSFFLKHFQSIHLIIFCCIALFVRNIVYVIFPSFEGAVFGQLLNSLTYGLFHTSVVLFIIEHINEKYIVMAQTIYSLIVQGFATVIGSTIAGYVIDFYGYQSLFVGFAFFPLAGAFLYFITKKHIQFNSFIIKNVRLQQSFIF
ncbi:MAG: MFS transporter, partial [Treponemataceae bacterium]